MIKALGAHTYLGTFEAGLRRVAELRVLGSIETWKPAIRARKACGTDALPPALDVKANLVFSNLPCSRFSMQSVNRFGHEQRANLDTFPELQDVIDLADRCDARVVWWETGPLAWKTGTKLIQEAHSHFRALETAVVKVDARWAGVPQERRRVHVIHSRVPLRTREELHGFDHVLRGGALSGFVRQAGDATPDPDAVKSARKYTWMEPREQFAELVAENTFGSKRPRAYVADDVYASPLNGRHLFWWDEGRWWTLQEALTLMGAPRAWGVAIAGEFAPDSGQRAPMQLICGGVNGDLAARLAAWIVVPTLEEGGSRVSDEPRWEIHRFKLPDPPCAPNTHTVRDALRARGINV